MSSIKTPDPLELKPCVRSCAGKDKPSSPKNHPLSNASQGYLAISELPSRPKSSSDVPLISFLPSKSRNRKQKQKQKQKPKPKSICFISQKEHQNKTSLRQVMIRVSVVCRVAMSISLQKLLLCTSVESIKHGVCCVGRYCTTKRNGLCR